MPPTMCKYLLAAADALDARPGRAGPAAWLAEELDHRFGADRRRWCRIPTRPGAGLRGRQAARPTSWAVLVSVAAWREREARERNMPAAWLVKDATLVELARRRPENGRAGRGSARA